MKHRWLNFRILHLAFWVASIATLVVRGSQPGFRVGWDLHVYENAMQALRMGHDPYADGIAAQRQLQPKMQAARQPIGKTWRRSYYYNIGVARTEGFLVTQTG